jgi:hypothetical protein
MFSVLLIFRSFAKIVPIQFLNGVEWRSTWNLSVSLNFAFKELLYYLAQIPQRYCITKVAFWQPQLFVG